MSSLHLFSHLQKPEETQYILYIFRLVYAIWQSYHILDNRMNWHGRCNASNLHKKKSCMLC